MASATKNNYCAFTVYLDGSDEEEISEKTDSESMQAAFEKFRRRRQEELQRIAGRKVSVQSKLRQPDCRWELRMKFLERAKSYIGVPYARKYHEPGSPEHESLLFLDCCGLIRRAVQDLTEDFGFYIGSGNQAYQYDTLPMTLSSEEHLKPGDLVFVSGTYFDTQRKRQPHDIVHVEIWLGDGERSLGARWKRGCVQIFDSYKFVSSSYGGMEYHFKSIETWLQGICTSHCPDHKWASARELPGEKSIFCPRNEKDEPVGAEESVPRPPLGEETMGLRGQCVAASIRNSVRGTSQQMEALDLQGVFRASPGVSQMNTRKRAPVIEVNQDESQALAQEMADLIVEWCDASLEGTKVQAEEGSEEGPVEPSVVASSQEADADARRSELTRDSFKLARKPQANSKVNPKGILAGNKRKKRGRAGMQGGWLNERQALDIHGKSAALHLGFRWYPWYFDADPKSIVSRRDEYKRMFENRALNDLQAQALSSLSSLADGEPTNETKSKGHRAATKATPRMSHLEEKKTEDAPRLGPFFYVGGANGVEMLTLYCRSKGWQRIHDNRREDYILKWCETKVRDTYYNFREGEQLLYQISNNKILTTKIGLLMNLREYERVMRKISKNCRHLKMEEFFPETFRLDTKDEREIFFEIYREPHIWICKPTGSNQGRGIFLLKNQSDVKELQAKLQSMEDDPVYKKLPYKLPQARIVQRYIDRPLLLEGKKFDVRSYLLIACTVPYMLFFGHGYARLTCLNYNPKSEDLTAHLTNQYVQKKNPMYCTVKEETVWRMDRFNNYVNERFRHTKGLPKDWVFNGFTKRMKEIMLQCFLSVKSKLSCKLGYFDLIGCDFLIDEDFKVWLLEMNANPALHTNCSALKSIIPTVVNETLDLAIEIFTKCQKGQPLLPLDSLCHFVLLYNGAASDLPPPRLTKSRTSIRSLRSYRPHMESSSSSSCVPSCSTSNTRLADKHPAKASEKTPKGDPKTEPSGLPEGLSLPPHKGVHRNPLLMPQIQISIVPSLMGCSPVKAVLRNNHVCASGNQYIIKHVPVSEKHPPGPTAAKADSGDDRAKANAGNAAGAIAKDRSYAAWFQQMFGTKFPSAAGSGTGLPLTSLQMVSLHLQSNIPPNLPGFQELSKPFRQLMTLAKPSMEDGKTAVSDVSRSCGESPPEDKKVAHRGS